MPDSAAQPSTDVRLRSGGQILVDALIGHGVDRAFGVPGESYLAVLDALHDAPIEFGVFAGQHQFNRLARTLAQSVLFKTSCLGYCSMPLV